jgi:SSS family solute:Na+ symporter
MGAVDTLVLVGYLLVVVGWGCLFARTTTSSEKFMSAGRNLPGWVVGLSIFGSYVSSISFLANPGKSYGGNWNVLVFALSLPIAAWAATKWYVPFFRRSGEVSAYQHLEHRFGAWARTYGVVCYLLTQLARLGSILYLLALALEPLVGLDLKTIIIISGFVVTIYPFFGGSEGVIWTGAVQAIVLVLGVLVCVAIAMMGMPDGPQQLFAMAAEANKFSLGSFGWPVPDPAIDAGCGDVGGWKGALCRIGRTLSEPTILVVFWYGLAINLQNFGIDQSYVQRYITARGDRAANASVWMGALSYIPLNMALLLIGTALWAYYQVHPTLPPGTPDDKVFPHFISTALPPGVTGLVLAAICSAAMDSNLNCCATLYLCDIHRRYFRPHISEAGSMWVLRLSVLIMGALSTWAALLMIGAKSALDLWWALAGILVGGILGLFLLGLIFRRANGLAAGLSTVLGVFIILWMTWSPKFQEFADVLQARGTSTSVLAGQVLSALYPYRYLGHSFLIPVVGTLVILLVGGALSFVGPFRRETPYVIPTSGEPA